MRTRSPRLVIFLIIIFCIQGVSACDYVAPNHAWVESVDVTDENGIFALTIYVGNINRGTVYLDTTSNELFDQISAQTVTPNNPSTLTSLLNGSDYNFTQLNDNIKLSVSLPLESGDLEILFDLPQGREITEEHLYVYHSVRLSAYFGIIGATGPFDVIWYFSHNYDLNITTFGYLPDTVPDFREIYFYENENLIRLVGYTSCYDQYHLNYNFTHIDNSVYTYDLSATTIDFDENILVDIDGTDINGQEIAVTEFHYALGEVDSYFFSTQDLENFINVLGLPTISLYGGLITVSAIMVIGYRRFRTS